MIVTTLLQQFYKNQTCEEIWKPQYHSAGCIVNIKIHSPLRDEPLVTMQMAVMDFSGAESNLEDEKGIETQKNNRKVYYTKLSVVD